MTQLWRSFGHVVPLFLIATVIVCIIAFVLAKKVRKIKLYRKTQFL
ncbi:hypothetical protein ACFCVQ_23345 [Bacillus thuringiensis]